MTVALAAVPLLVAAAGCTALTVRTPAGVAVSLWDTKDNAVQLDKLTWDPNTPHVEVSGFKLTNNASAPIAAYTALLTGVLDRLAAIVGRLEVTTGGPASSSEPALKTRISVENPPTCTPPPAAPR